MLWPSKIFSRYSRLVSGTSWGQYTGIKDSVNLDRERMDLGFKLLSKLSCTNLTECSDHQGSWSYTQDNCQELSGVHIQSYRTVCILMGKGVDLGFKFLTKLVCIILKGCPDHQRYSKGTQDYCQEHHGININRWRTAFILMDKWLDLGFKFSTKLSCTILAGCPDHQESSVDTQDNCQELPGVHIQR